MSATPIAIVGTGVMGEMVLGGLLRSGVAAADLKAAVRTPEKAAVLSGAYGVVVADARTAVTGAATIVLGVKPQDMGTALDEIADLVAPGTIVVTLAAGLPTTFYEVRLPGARVVRTMPNTPGLVGEGMTAIAPGASADAAAIDTAAEILGTVGRVVVIDESDIDLVSAVSGSGPAYVFLLAETMRDAAVELGLAPELAAQLVRQTVVGAGALIKSSDDAPEVLRARVTSKKGTTHEAITTLEASGAREAMVAAMAAAVARARELAQGS